LEELANKIAGEN